MGIREPENWEQVIASSEAPRSTYKEIRDARPVQDIVRKAMNDFIENSKCENNIPQTGYIRSLGLDVVDISNKE